MKHLLAVLVLLLGGHLARADGNRLAHLDEASAHYPHRTFPRLTTPQWVGEKGVEAAVILAIDDMRGHENWERYLRPILNRLHDIEGRAPVSIMTCTIDPKHAHLQRWLKEGLSLETHTVDHPCPLLGKAGLEAARSTYERCVDLLASVPGNKPVAFRVPCCDSQNTPSPRFFSEIFNGVTSKRNFLSIDSSVFNVFTSDDPDLPRALVQDNSGRERFRKYLPGGGTFVNTIHDYPYPYVIDRLCWEFPCATPSDWQGQAQHGNASPTTLADMKASLDATVRKQGVYCLVFHPYQWIKAEQVVELIDHAVKTHGKKVKFLTFRDAHDRLVKNLLGGQALRTGDGQDNGVRVVDLNGDGFMDVVLGTEEVRKTRVWNPTRSEWVESTFPLHLTAACKGKCQDAGVRFGVLSRNGYASCLTHNRKTRHLYHFDGKTWVESRVGEPPVETARDLEDRGVRLRDLDGDGICELIVGNADHNSVYTWSDARGWTKAPFALPEGMHIVEPNGRDAGLRFVDVDDDGQLDVLFSNAERYSLHLFSDLTRGWSRRALAGKAGDKEALPIISRNGTNNGAWFSDRTLVVQNELTFNRPGLVERRSFNDMLATIEQGPRSPSASLRALRARPGFVVEQMAAEPLVMDPIAFAWGPDAKLWVVEMGDYPLGLPGKKAGGRVVFLESSKGDGRYDKRTVFLDNLGFPTGVLPWRKGVLVTCAPDIILAEDTNGDGKADKRTVLFTGFREGNQQHRVNGLVWGLDNRIHVANGDSGGRIRSLKTGQTVDISGRDLAIHPDTVEMWPLTGQTQFGRNRDDVGNWFGGNNSVPMVHYVLPDSYLKRNPAFAAPEVRVQVPAVPGAAPVFPRSRTMARFNDPGAANRFTSACSPIVYRDDLFGPHFSKSLFVSEPVHNLVHREILSPSGVTFRGERAGDERDREFLASTDNWFRPTMIQTGPDGALWVADMYRQVIEHPEWIPKDTQKRLDLRSGHDRGRLYRVYPVGTQRPIPRLDNLDAAGLVAALDSPSGWQRDLAHQLLVQRDAKEAAPLLIQKLEAKRPLTRMQALCVLDGLKSLPAKALLAALQDSEPAVRRHAVRLCEGRLENEPDLAKEFAKLVRDDDATVRLQFAFSVGEWRSAKAGQLLGQLLCVEKERFIRSAALSSLRRDNLEGVLTAVLKEEPKDDLLGPLLRQADAMKHEKAVITFLFLAAKSGNKEWHLDALADFLDGLEQRGSSLAKLRSGAEKDFREALDLLEIAFAQMRLEVVEDKSEAELVRRVRLLGRGEKQKDDRELLGKLLDPRKPERVQLAVVTALARQDDAAIPGVLLAGWKGHAPSVRTAVLDALLERPVRQLALVDAMEKKHLTPLDLDVARRQVLLTHRDKAVRARAEKILSVASSDRVKILASYRDALTTKGDPTRGKAVFAKSCSACHRLEGVGNETGPDLAALSGKTAEYLLTAILDPNQAVETRYLAYLAQLADGRQVTGMLSGSTATSITLTLLDGKTQTVLRRNLERLESTGKSLMPEGLEKEIPVPAMADLLAYLRDRQPATKPKSFANNKPEVVRPDKDGSLRLTASKAEIYGPTLVFEAPHRNLGFWSSVQDRAIWSVDTPRAGKYEVWLDHALDRSGAGNVLVVELDSPMLEHKMAATGSWEDYRDVRIGRLDLPAGRARLTVRSKGAIRGALIDLRTLRLVPVK